MTRTHTSHRNTAGPETYPAFRPHTPCRLNSWKQPQKNTLHHRPSSWTHRIIPQKPAQVVSFSATLREVMPQQRAQSKQGLPRCRAARLLLPACRTLIGSPRHPEMGSLLRLPEAPRAQGMWQVSWALPQVFAQKSRVLSQHVMQLPSLLRDPSLIWLGPRGGDSRVVLEPTQAFISTV